MSKLIKSGGAEKNPWNLIPEDSSEAKLSDGHWLAPPDLFNTLSQEALFDPKRIGLVVSGDEELETIQELVQKAQTIAINFPTFTDGRGFSLARMLREHLEYTGQLIAVGNFIQDQLHYLSRCGFDTFEVADDADVDSHLQSLQDFTESYQAAVDEPQPLFRRRA